MEGGAPEWIAEGFPTVPTSLNDAAGRNGEAVRTGGSPDPPSNERPWSEEWRSGGSTSAPKDLDSHSRPGSILRL